jgi:hypothetical protein
VNDVAFRIVRDGVVIADLLPGPETAFVDTDADPSSSSSPCYVIESTYLSSGNHSHHSPPVCFWGTSYERITTIGASAMEHTGGLASTEHGLFHYEPWGDAGHSLTAYYTPTASGPHLLQVTFGNGAGPVNSGITCGVKRVVVEEAATGNVVAEGALVMPQLGTWGRWEDSSFVSATLAEGVQVRIIIDGDDDMVNMSSFAHFESFTGGSGGGSESFNRVNIAELKVLQR